MIRAATSRGLVEIALERPEAKNALDLAMVRELRLALAAASRDTAVVVLKSAVPGVFSLGMDLAALQAGIAAGASSPEVHEAAGEYVGLLKDISTLRAITIAEVDGMAVGGGVDLIAACDLAIASDRSAFSIAQLRKGIFPLTTSGVVVPRIGHRAFLAWMLSGQNYSADKARRLGLVAQVAPHGEVAARVKALVDRILSYDREALRLGIEALRFQPSLPVADRLDHLGALLALNCQIPRAPR